MRHYAKSDVLLGMLNIVPHVCYVVNAFQVKFRFIVMFFELQAQ